MKIKWSWEQTQALVVRLVLFLHFLLVAWRVWVAWYGMLWLLPCAIVPFLVETAFTVFIREGEEWQWLSFCFLFYSSATVPGIWLLEIKKTETYLTTNSTDLDGITIPGLNISLQLSSDTWRLVAEELFLYLMTLGRWVLPRGHMNRKDLFELVLAYLGMASDIMDLFSLFESDNIRVEMYMTYALLAVWSWSVLQFSLTFCIVQPPLSDTSNTSNTSPDTSNTSPDTSNTSPDTSNTSPDTSNTSPDSSNTSPDTSKTSADRWNPELAATLVSLFMQDGPFLVLRMYAIVVYKIINHSMIFFVSKNIVVICLLLYKIFIEAKEDSNEVKRDKDKAKRDKEETKRNNDKAKRDKDAERIRKEGAAYDNPVASVSDERQTMESCVDETNNIKQD